MDQFKWQNKDIESDSDSLTYKGFNSSEENNNDSGKILGNYYYLRKRIS